MGRGRMGHGCRHPGRSARRGWFSCTGSVWQSRKCSWWGSPPPDMKMPWRYRADGAWSSPPPRYESITASRGSWPVLRNRKRTHVPGLVRLDNGQTRSEETVDPRDAGHSEPYPKKARLSSPTRPWAHSNRRFAVAQKDQDPFPPNGRRIVGGGWCKSPSRPLRQQGCSRRGGCIFTIN